MLQKVAAMVDKVAADLGLMAYEVRWLLPKKYFDFAASSAAVFFRELYMSRHYNSKQQELFKSTT